MRIMFTKDALLCFCINTIKEITLSCVTEVHFAFFKEKITTILAQEEYNAICAQIFQSYNIILGIRSNLNVLDKIARKEEHLMEFVFVIMVIIPKLGVNGLENNT